jgi:valyl-tRNA synthetase
VTDEVTRALAEYRYADAAKALYGFAWDEFCSFYVEMVKARLSDERLRPTAQRVLAHTLDTLLRLLHPMIPFVTEEVWQLLAEAAPQRGIDALTKPAESIMIAPWPLADMARQNGEIEARFARFQEVLRAIRDIRTRQNVPQRKDIHFSVRCDKATADLLRPMEPYFASMACARATAWGPAVAPPELSANVALSGIEVFVDLAELIDVEAEIARNTQEVSRLDGLIAAKQKKLENANFVERAPAAVVEGERKALKDLEDQLAAVRAVIERLKKKQA